METKINIWTISKNLMVCLEAIHAGENLPEDADETLSAIRKLRTSIAYDSELDFKTFKEAENILGKVIAVNQVDTALVADTLTDLRILYDGIDRRSG